MGAAAGLFLAEATPWVVDRYIRNVGYVQISAQTVSHNLNPGNWTWDGDGFTTNQFGHPYHGSFFFSAFRVNGYSFWQAAPAAFAGSYIWETLAENQAPAPNDLINTGFGGVVLGEMTYRLANRIISNHSRGAGRQASEVLALLINPTNGLNRLLSGKWGKPPSGPAQRDSSPLSAEFDLGARKFKANSEKGGYALYAHVRLLYGSPFENYAIPFTHIAINAEFGKDDSSKINIISVYGSLAGWRVPSGPSSRHVVVLSANYDYINNEAFFYSAQSIKANLISEFRLTQRLRLNTSIGAGPVILSAVPDAYVYKERYYDYCTGAGFAGNFALCLDKKLYYTINYRAGWLKTVNGNTSHYLLHAVTGELSYSFLKGWSITAETGYFSLNAYYGSHDDIRKAYPYWRVSFRYTIGSRQR